MFLGGIEASDVLLAGGFGAAGIVATVITYRLARRRPELVYATYGSTVVGAARMPDIEIRFRGRDVPRVSRTVVYLWNAGRGVVNSADVVERDPIRLRFEGEVLDAAIQRWTRDVVNFAIELDEPHDVRVNFDFIDADDGLLIEVLHTGRQLLNPVSSAQEPFRVLGTVKGQPRGIRKQRASPLDSPWIPMLYFLPLMPLSTVLISAFRWKALVALLVYLLLLPVLFIRSRRRRLSPEPIGIPPPNIRRAPRALLQNEPLIVSTPTGPVAM